jgi:hypothetical protein
MKRRTNAVGGIVEDEALIEPFTTLIVFRFSASLSKSETDSDTLSLKSISYKLEVNLNNI